MRLITPTLPGMGLRREGINQRNIASRTHWTQPQTCEPRHFLTPSTGRNNYLVSDTVRGQLEHPLFETKPAIRSSSHVILTVLCPRVNKRGNKGLAACSPKSPEVQSCCSQTDRGSRPWPGLLSWAACTIRPAMLLLQTTACRPGRNKSPGSPWARVTASATLKGDQHGLAGSSTRPNLLFFSPRGQRCSSSTRFDEQFHPA